MSWQEAVNRGLARTTGYQLRRVGARRRRLELEPADRLVTAPAFILSTVRSGSTLLRVLLDSHSEIHSPHELHLREIGVTVTDGYPVDALREIGLDQESLQHLLWDRVLHRELVESGKRMIVNKTPNDVFIADAIRRCWPDARFIFLLRHPAAVARSRAALRPQDGVEQNVKMVRSYAIALERARLTYDGLTVRYEQLTADPAGVMREVCAYLGVAYEPSMLEYGKVGHGRYKPGLGDWKEKIRSGRVQQAEPLPSADDVPATLMALARAWGYVVPDEVTATVTPPEPLDVRVSRAQPSIL